MSVYVAPFTFDFAVSQIRVNSGVVNVSVIDLYDACKLARETEEGIVYDHIAEGSGKVSLGGGVQVGLTVALVGSWQVKFADGSYIASIRGGNLVGGPGGDPVAYSPGVQVLLVQSAASTIVNTSGGGATAEEIADEVWMRTSRTLTGVVDADVTYVNGIPVSGSGTEADPWGPP